MQVVYIKGKTSQVICLASGTHNVCFAWKVQQMTAEFCYTSKLLTDSSIVEHRRQDEQDVVGPVLPVVGHLKLFDDQNVEVRGAFHGMEQVEQAVLLASCCWCEDWTFQHIRVLHRNRDSSKAKTDSEVSYLMDVSREL